MKHIKYADRLIIKKMIDENKRIEEIAEVIGVHKATIYNEIRRGTDRSYSTGLYDPDKAQMKL